MAVLFAACSGGASHTPRSENGALSGGPSTTAGAQAHSGAATTAPPRVTTTSLARTTTTAPKPDTAAQPSYGPVKGESTTASIGNVVTDVSGRLTFTLDLRNAGSLPYNCGALKALARTDHGDSAIVAPLGGPTGLPCGTDNTIAPGDDKIFAFFIPLVGEAARQVVALPYGSLRSEVVWSVSGT